jgi:hypothetical protein
MTPPTWSALLTGFGFGAGLIFGIAALSLMFAVTDRLQKRRQRRRIARAPSTCRQCDFAGDWTQVTVHEALDHHHEDKP